MTSTYNRIFAGSVSAAFVALGLVSSAQADGYSAPRAAYERPFSWTGLYIGGNAGWVDSSIQWVYHDPSLALADRPLCGGLGCDITQQKGIYGAHAGYQYQFGGGIVVGLEAAISFPADGGFATKPCFNVL